MNRFVSKTDKSRAKVGRKVTPMKRHLDPHIKEWTHVSGNKLFCTSCNKVLTHERRCVVLAHLKSFAHATSLKRQSVPEPDAQDKKQKTVP